MIKLGILGGGQLARMLCLKAEKLKIKTYVLSLKKTDPAANVCSNWIQGSPHSLSHLKSFCKKIDYLTFENEFVNTKQIQKASTKKLQCRPKLHTLAKLQDRLFQKNLLLKHKVKTAEFYPLSQIKDIKSLLNTFPKGAVLKQRQGGYDGNKTFIIKKTSDFTKLRIKKEDFIAEAFIPFKRELAISIARNKKGQIVLLPLVESFQKDQRCLWVKGPIKCKKFKKTEKNLIQFVKSIKYEGILAFELFEYKDQFLVNELAPRVHNSAHYSMDALSEGQFLLHLKAILNKSLKKPKLLTKGFAMYNLLGDKRLRKNTKMQKGSFLHWYEKKENKKARKMGHINVLDKGVESALKKALKLKNTFYEIK